MPLRIPILQRYIFKEMLSPFWVGLFVFTGILFLVRILRLIDLVVNKNVPITDILLLFSFVIPRFLEIAIPMSLLLAIILSFGRLSSDSELVVLRASGISLRKLSMPVVYFALLTFLCTLVIGFWLRPWANHRLGVGMFEIAKMRASAGLIAGTFNDLGTITLYAEGVSDEGRRLSNVIIADRRNPDQASNFIAKHGAIISDDDTRTITLRLYDGSIHRSHGLNYDLTYFDINNISLDQKELLEDDSVRGGKKTKELNIKELTDRIAVLKAKPTPLSTEDFKQLSKYQVDWHSRFALAAACFCVAFVAMALGIQPSRGGDSWGRVANVIVGILVIVIYYAMLAFVTALGEKGTEPIWLLVWLPNIIFALLAYGLFRLMESERWMAVSQILGHGFVYIASKLHVSREENE